MLDGVAVCLIAAEEASHRHAGRARLGGHTANVRRPRPGRLEDKPSVTLRYRSDDSQVALGRCIRHTELPVEITKEQDLHGVFREAGQICLDPLEFRRWELVLQMLSVLHERGHS